MIQIVLPKPHAGQAKILREAKRFNVLSCGRRFGKTVIALLKIASASLRGQTCAYLAPKYKDLVEFWSELVRYLTPVIVRSNANDRVIELSTGGKIEFWSLEDKDATRSRHYHLVIIDEAAKAPNLEYSWVAAIRATLADYQGEAWFLSTPRGKDNYFYTLWERGQSDSPEDAKWASWQMPTSTNPKIKPEELEDMLADMGTWLYEQEVNAEFLEDREGALWNWALINDNRVNEAPDLRRIVVAIDPAVTTNANSNLTGIVVAGIGLDKHGYVLKDATFKASPNEWASRAIALYREFKADKIVAEVNQGQNLIENTLRTIDPQVPYKAVNSRRGKLLRAEPIAALYEQGKVHHVGDHRDLELQLCNWVPGEDSPDRLDALVHGLTELMLGNQGTITNVPRHKLGF